MNGKSAERKRQPYLTCALRVESEAERWRIARLGRELDEKENWLTIQLSGTTERDVVYVECSKYCIRVNDNRSMITNRPKTRTGHQRTPNQETVTINRSLQH